ncbi:MAG TPA: GNAT family N-acetyltransferase [Thermoanaerobaculia bacterium]|nr:GNAT family N-acetyltransferase [Thermoanaerobaculia bacterium]
MIEIRAARVDESDWVNERYAEVRFIPSDLANDLVLIAEIDGHPAGLGRLVTVDGDSCELGGMLVFDAFRGRGIARALIAELVTRAGERAIYCIPFAKLEPLYAEFFERTEDAPEPVRAKYEWCQRTYEEPVLLMVTRSRGHEVQTPATP